MGTRYVYIVIGKNKTKKKQGFSNTNCLGAFFDRVKAQKHSEEITGYDEVIVDWAELDEHSSDE